MNNRTTWYIRDASGNVISIYEQPGVDSQTPANAQEPVIETTSPLTPTEVPVYGSGKVGTYYPFQDGSMSYEITDHLGNVRALLRDDIKIYTATMEDSGDDSDLSNPRHDEKIFFQNIEETEKDDPAMNHTPDSTVVPTPSRSAYLFWQSGVAGMDASDKATGPAIALVVSPGDTIKAETFVRYENKATYNRNGITLGVLSSLLGGSYGSVLGFDDYSVPQTTQLFNDALAAGDFLGDGDDTSVPFAYISYIVFNESMVRIASDRVRVTEAAGFDAPAPGPNDDHDT